MKLRGVSVFLMCCIGMLGAGLFALPTAATHFAGTFYWGPILAAGAVSLAAVLLFGGVSEETFCDACIKILPRTGRWLAWGYVAVYTAVAALLLAYFSATVQNWFLDGVPRWFTALFLNMVCLYTATKPTKTIVRLLAFLGVFLLLTVTVMRFVLLFSGDIRNLLPLTEGFSPVRMPGAIGFVFGFFVLSGVIGILEVKQKTKQTAAAWAVGVSTLVFILATAGCISVLGSNQTARHLDSAVLAMKNLNLSKTDFLQRGDMVFIVSWSFLVPSAGTLAAHIPLQGAFRLCPEAKRRWILPILYLLFCIAALALRTQEATLVCFVYTSAIGSAVVLILFPLILRFVQRRKRR